MPFSFEILLLVFVGIGLCLLGNSTLLPLSLLVILRLQSPVVLFWIFKRIAYQLHSQSLHLYLLDILLLHIKFFGLFQSLCKFIGHLVEFKHFLPHFHLLLEGLVELKHIKVGHKHKIIHGGLFQSLDYKVVHDDHIVGHKSSTLLKER